MRHGRSQGAVPVGGRQRSLHRCRLVGAQPADGEGQHVAAGRGRRQHADGDGGGGDARAQADGGAEAELLEGRQNIRRGRQARVGDGRRRDARDLHRAHDRGALVGKKGQSSVLGGRGGNERVNR